jgi:hypothetical protein
MRGFDLLRKVPAEELTDVSLALGGLTGLYILMENRKDGFVTHLIAAD